MKATYALLTAFVGGLLALHASAASAAITKTELAGNSLSEFPFFEYVKAFNVNAPIKVAIDPIRFPSIVGKTCDIYVVNTKSPSQWIADHSLTDVTAGGAQTQTFSGTTIQANTFQVAGPSELSANAGTGLGVGYDVVLDCDRNGTLSDGDFIDGARGEAGLYVVHDTTAAGPLAVTETIYNIDSGVGSTFGIPATHLGEDLYFPANIATMGKVPLVVVGHGNGHNFQWYGHIGNHLASYGYVVVSIANNTGPGPNSAADTTLGHTDAFIDQAEAGAIAGGALVGHIDSHKIVWIGHSRGAEAVAISYDRLFDGTVTPTHFAKKDIRLIDSMLPTDFEGTDVSNPHDANYHLWTASGDADVNGSAGCNLCQTFHLHDRATGYRQSTVVQGTGHGWFHNNNAAGAAFSGPCPIGPPNTTTHLIQLGYLLPLVKHYVEGNVPALDFLTRQYEDFRPIGVPTGNPCIVVSNEYRNGASIGNFVIDDYQTQTGTGVSSSGGAVTFDVENLTEGRLDDNNADFVWTSTDPFNGATQAGPLDTSRGVVFDWTGQDRFYEWQVPASNRNFSSFLFLSFRAAQGTRHPNTLAAPGYLNFAVTLRDGLGATSSIRIGAYGSGLVQPYARDGGWHNEMRTIRMRTTDFLNNGAGLNLADVVAVRLNFGPTFGSSRGRIVVDDLMLTNDLTPTAAQIQVPSGVTFGHSCVGIKNAGTLNVCNTGKDDLIVSAITSSDPQFTIVSPSAGFPVVVSHDFCFPFSVSFAPTSMGPQASTLTIQTNDATNPSVTVPATAQVGTGSLGLAADELFPPTVIRSVGTCQSKKPLVVSNRGTCDLTITNVAISGADAADFSLSGMPAVPVTLEAGHTVGSGDLDAVFSPIAVARERTAQVTVTFVSDPGTGTTSTQTSNLCGEGVRTGARVLVTQGGVPMPQVHEIELKRFHGGVFGFDKEVDEVKNVTLQTVTPTPGTACAALQFHREYGAVTNPEQLVPGVYQLKVEAIIAGHEERKKTWFKVDTCGFNGTIVVDF